MSMMKMDAFESCQLHNLHLSEESDDLHKRALLLDCPSGFTLLLSSLKCTSLEETAVAAIEDDVDGWIDGVDDEEDGGWMVEDMDFDVDIALMVDCFNMRGIVDVYDVKFFFSAVVSGKQVKSD
jgi:hypothetical protein